MPMQPSVDTRNSMLEHIHAARGVASLLVVLFHLTANLRKEKYFGVDAGDLANFFSFGGNAGVSFFFVLSGFLIGYIHIKDVGRTEELAGYLKKRAMRVYPMYLFVFFLVYSLAVLAPQFREAMPTDAGILLRSIFLLPQDPLVVGGTGAPVVIVAWTLQYEIAFYAFFGLFIWSPWFAFCLFAATFLLANFGQDNIKNIFLLRFFGEPIALLFLFGIVASLSSIRYFGARFRELLIGGGAIGFCIACWMDVVKLNGKFLPIELIYGVFSAILILGLSVTKARKAPHSNFFEVLDAIGSSSYSLYLIHFPLISLLSKFSMVARDKFGGGVYVYFLVALVITVFVCHVCHLYIEVPLNKFVKQKFYLKGRQDIKTGMT